jgi:hypothetical protein
MQTMNDINNPINEIVSLNEKICNFWSKCGGWAPDEAYELLLNSRLDRQVSLSRCLHFWYGSINIENEDGALILAWANLGSLVEGTLQLFLSVYLLDYKNDVSSYIDNPLPENKWLREFVSKKNEIILPPVLTLEKLKIFLVKKKILSSDYHKLIEEIQLYRNSIHAYKQREIGDSKKFNQSVFDYLELIKEIDYSIPYP